MNLSWLLGILGISSCASRVPVPPSASGNDRRELAARMNATEEPAILFVGNSYSFGIPREFKKLAAERGKKVRIGHSTYGGWTLGQHAANEATLRKIRGGRWDVVVIQEQSLIPAMPARLRAAKMFPPLRLLVAEARAHGAIPVLYQTWGRRDGDPARRGDDFLKMTQRLREGCQAAANHAGGLVVVPVGDAWELETNAGRGDTLFLDDGSHPAAMGNRVTAEVFYRTFFGV